MLQAYLGHPLERLQAQNETPPMGWAGAFEKVVKNILIVMVMLPRPLAEGEMPSALPM